MSPFFPVRIVSCGVQSQRKIRNTAIAGVAGSFEGPTTTPSIIHATTVPSGGAGRGGG